MPDEPKWQRALVKSHPDYADEDTQGVVERGPIMGRRIWTIIGSLYEAEDYRGRLVQWVETSEPWDITTLRLELLPEFSSADDPDMEHPDV
jgi:hypothetical protein